MANSMALGASVRYNSFNEVSKESPSLAEVSEAIRRIIRDGNRAADVMSHMRVEEIVILIQSDVRRNKVTLQMDLAANLSPVIGDRVQLQQVILKFILNAIEAMSGVEHQEREQLVRTRCDDGHQVRVAVQDSGIGFDPLKTERMFDPFYSTKPSGLGIGLSISRSIVEAHGGRLRAKANAPSGALFEFTLPTRDETAF